MRRTILFGIMAIAALSMVLQACANLVPTAEVPPADPVSLAATPDLATVSGPAALSGNATTNTVPATTDGSTALDPATAAVLNAAMGMLWPPASDSALSPLQAITSFDVAGVGLTPIEPVLESALSPVSFNELISSDMGWLFAGIWN